MSNDRRSRVGLPIALVVAVLVMGACLSQTGPTMDRLTYSLPTTLSIQQGGALFSTGIVYDGHTEEGAWLVIDGQRALKRQGDSVKWGGSLVPGTETELDLRIVWITEDKVDLAGTAKITIQDVAPQKGPIATSSPVTFTGPVAYGVATSSYIPGTTLTYLGQTEQGAELGGLVNEFPYRQIGDSIIWEGTLREHVYLRAELRTVQFSTDGLRVAGVVTLWLGE